MEHKLVLITRKAHDTTCSVVHELDPFFKEGWRLGGQIHVAAVRAFLFFHTHIAITVPLIRDSK